MQRILITGANRGLGFEFARQYLQRGDRVFAGSRQPDRANELKSLASNFPRHLTMVALDVADPQSVREAHDSLRQEVDALDLLINNAGVYSAKGSRSPRESLGTLSFNEALLVMRINAIGPMLLAQQVFDLLKASGNAKIVNITSGYGSVSGNTSGFPYYYAASKAALNQLTRSLAADTRKSRIIAVVMDPGWVATDMGGPEAPISTQESVQSMIGVIDRLTFKQNGQNLNRFGENQPW